MKIKLLGSELTESINAAAGTFSPNRVYHLAPIRLLKVGCPREIAASSENRRMVPIVVEKNRRKLGQVLATGWSPEAVVVAGGATRHAILDHGHLMAMAWLEAGLEVNASEAFTCAELTQKLQNAVTQKLYGEKGRQALQPYPFVTQVYPFEGFVIHSTSGKTYRQPFSIDPVARTVALSGVSLQVEACGGAGQTGMPKVQTGVHSVSNPIPLAWNQVSWRSGGTSELFTQVVRDSSNVLAKVARLSSMIRHGVLEPTMPDFAPVLLTWDQHIMAPFIKAGISPVDAVRGLASLVRA